MAKEKDTPQSKVAMRNGERVFLGDDLEELKLKVNLLILACEGLENIAAHAVLEVKDVRPLTNFAYQLQAKTRDLDVHAEVAHG